MRKPTSFPTNRSSKNAGTIHFLEDGLEEFGGRLAQHFADFKNESGRKKYFQTSDPLKNRGLGVYLY